jgi:2-amino-4-hydroxy-6-hydroxymethyldihydropteridine diphosphokinase
VLNAVIGGRLAVELGLGLFYLCALPSTVSSSVAMTATAHGNVAGAVFNATLSSLIGIVVTPLWMAWVMKATGETPPIGPAGQGNYLNQMIALETSLTPDALLDHLLRIERQLGRERGDRWTARTIDLDIVQFGNQVIDSDRLTLPHPQLPNRDFWQRELIELRGDWR